MFKGSDWKEEFETFRQTNLWGKLTPKQYEEIIDFISKQILEAYQKGWTNCGEKMIDIVNDSCNSKE